MRHFTYINIALRGGVAFAFLYPAIDGFFHPDSWLWFFPKWVLDYTNAIGLADTTVLILWGVVEIIIAAGVLFSRDPRIPALGAAIILFLIVTLDFSAFEVVFRDIPILLMAVALIILHRDGKLIECGVNNQLSDNRSSETEQ